MCAVHIRVVKSSLSFEFQNRKLFRGAFFCMPSSTSRVTATDVKLSEVVKVSALNRGLGQVCLVQAY